MATLNATPANVSQVVSSAQPGDEVILAAGTYASLPRKSGITISAHDWAEGRAVRDTTGHNGQGFTVRVTGALNIGESDFTLRGVYHDTSGLGSINAGVISGDNVTLADCVSNARRTDGGRQIGYTIGTGTKRVSGFRYLRCRHLRTGQAGQALDHAIYLKNATGWLVEDCIIIDGGRFPLHLYTNADNGVVRRTIVWGSGGAITFSGASDSSTGTSVYGTSDNNVVERSILGRGSTGYLVESWTSDSSRPVSGNVVRDTIITRAGGAAGLVKPSIAGVSVVNCPDIDPGFANVAAGDFRNISGYGPSYLQPTAPPPPPPPDPDPDPGPPPSGDPCAAVKAERDAALAEKASAEAERDEAQAAHAEALTERDRARQERDEARAERDQLQAVVADDVRDATMIRNNSRSTAGDLRKRLDANVVAAQRIIDRGQ